MKSLNVVKQMREGAFNGDLNHIYCAQTLNLSYYKNRLERTVRDFEYTFGKDRDVYVFSAPGRCEICGNHTDHQNGKVLAASINLDIIAVVSKNDDRKINLKSNGYRLTTIDLDGDPIERKGTTAALIRGISQRFKELGHIVGGFDCFTSSDVLVGSGLSSSASFEILIGTIINHLYCKLKKSPLEIAKIGQYAENKYFGKPSGLMDQTACSVGGFIKMDFESKQPKIESLTFDLDSLDYSLCIVDTHASHSGLTYEYAKIPSDMRAVAKYFKKDVLREVDEAVFYQEIPNIRKRLGDRPLLRAMHFFNEEKRVDQAFEALKKMTLMNFCK